jgi:hypothetical protein
MLKVDRANDNKMNKPVYKHPDFVTQTDDKRIEKENKRLWLSLKIDSKLKEVHLGNE